MKAAKSEKGGSVEVEFSLDLASSFFFWFISHFLLM